MQPTLAYPKDCRQGLSKVLLFSMGLPMDSAHRRRRLNALLNGAFKGDRQRLIAKSGRTEGRISQLLNEDPFGERAARSLEYALGLPPNYFDVEDDLQAGLVPFRDLNNLESQLVTLFRHLSERDQLAALTSLDKSIRTPPDTPGGGKLRATRPNGLSVRPP